MYRPLGIQGPLTASCASGRDHVLELKSTFMFLQSSSHPRSACCPISKAELLCFYFFVFATQHVRSWVCRGGSVAPGKEPVCQAGDLSLTPGSARKLEWVAISSSRGSSWSRDRTCVSRVSCIADGFSTCWDIREPPTSYICSIIIFVCWPLFFNGIVHAVKQVQQRDYSARHMGHFLLSIRLCD